MKIIFYGAVRWLFLRYRPHDEAEEEERPEQAQGAGEESGHFKPRAAMVSIKARKMI